MKTVVLSLVGFVLGIGLGRWTRPVLPVEYQNNFSFNIPCMEHGFHTQVVSSNRLVRLYEITVEGEVKGEATGEQIAEVLEMIKAMENVQSIPNDQK